MSHLKIHTSVASIKLFMPYKIKFLGLMGEEVDIFWEDNNKKNEFL
jgi:hypothetical protein